MCSVHSVLLVQIRPAAALEQGPRLLGGVGVIPTMTHSGLSSARRASFDSRIAELGGMFTSFLKDCGCYQK